MERVLEVDQLGGVIYRLLPADDEAVEFKRNVVLHEVGGAWVLPRVGGFIFKGKDLCEKRRPCSEEDVEDMFVVLLVVRFVSGDHHRFMSKVFDIRGFEGMVLKLDALGFK